MSEQIERDTHHRPEWVPEQAGAAEGFTTNVMPGIKSRHDGLPGGASALSKTVVYPATARRLSHRIAAHFVADDPPPALTARLEQTWTRTGGDLAQVAHALAAAPETWTPQPAKVKTPYEFVMSAHRALGVAPQRLQPLRQALIAMGQPPLGEGCRWASRR